MPGVTLACTQNISGGREILPAPLGSKQRISGHFGYNERLMVQFIHRLLSYFS